MNVVHGAHTSAAFAEPPFRVLSSTAFPPPFEEAMPPPRRRETRCRRGGRSGFFALHNGSAAMGHTRIKSKMKFAPISAKRRAWVRSLSAFIFSLSRPFRSIPLFTDEYLFRKGVYLFIEDHPEYPEHEEYTENNARRKIVPAERRFRRERGTDDGRNARHG